MLSGILLAVLTGLCWTAFGVVLSFTARGKHNIVAFGIVQNLSCALISLAFFTTPSALGDGRPSALFALIFAGGFLNSLAQFVTNRAMKQGHNSIIWAACTMKYRLNDRQIYRRNRAEDKSTTEVILYAANDWNPNPVRIDR